MAIERVDGPTPNNRSQSSCHSVRHDDKCHGGSGVCAWTVDSGTRL